MNLTTEIAKQFRGLHFGGNWTAANLKDTVTEVSWQQAISKVNGFNSIATLVYHANYYVSAVLKVLQGGPLDASDKFSFTHPPIACKEDWEQLPDQVQKEAEGFDSLVEQLPDAALRRFCRWQNIVTITAIFIVLLNTFTTIWGRLY